MKRIIPIIILFAFLIQSCAKDCEERFTPPQRFLFELVDKNTGENLFTNGTFEPQQIRIKNTITNKPYDFQFIAENNFNVIAVAGIGWQTELVNLEFKIIDNPIFELLVDAKRKSDDCYTFTSYHKIEIKNAEFNINPENGVYRILVDN